MISIRALTEDDPPVIAAAFAALGWPGKTVERYRRYLAEQSGGTRPVFVATVDGTFAGYVTILWRSGYAPFRDASVPEVSDLNVLPPFRRRHVATALMDEAEALIGSRGDTSGLGVGLYRDYGPAHAMYLARGYRPDGNGIVYGDEPVPPGTTVRVDDDLILMMTRKLR